MKTLPDTVGRLTALANLKIVGLALTELPASIGGLGTLHMFELGCAPLIKKLPETVGRLTALVNLAIARCGQLTERRRHLGVGRCASLSF